MNLGQLSLRLGLGFLVTVVAAAGIVYATDYGLEATVVDKSCGSGGFLGQQPAGGPTVTLRTKIGGLRHTQGLPFEQCGAVQVGNHVVYHIRSGRTSLYEREGGSCMYDSVGGVNGCP